MWRCNIDPSFLLGSLLLSLLLVSCSRGIGDEEYQEMYATSQDQTLVLDGFEEFARNETNHHQLWWASQTDSTISPAGYARFSTDSLLKVELTRLDQRFRKWFANYTFATRKLRLHVDGTQNWLRRSSLERSTSTWVRREWASRTATYLGLTESCKEIQSQYRAWSDAYGRIRAIPGPENG